MAAQLTTFKTVPTSRLAFDPRNPRIMPETLSEDPDEQLRQIWRSGNAQGIATDILNGDYVAPAPLLAIAQDNTDILTVVDGNQRLAALIITHSERAMQAVDPHGALKKRKPLEGNPEHTVTVVDSWLRAHRLQLRRQNPSENWNWMAIAMDARRLIEEGLTFSEAVNTYSDNSSWPGHIARLLTTLNIWDIVNESPEDRYSRSSQFTMLSKALNFSNIRAALGLDEHHAPQTIDQDHQTQARTLMAQICGTAKGKKHVSPCVSHSSQLELLNDVYADPKALEDLIKHPQTDVRHAWNHMTGHHDMWEIKRSLETLQHSANEAMAELKTNSPQLFPNNTQVNVAHATFNLQSDGSAEYTVHLKARKNREFPQAAEALQQTLRKSGFPHCHVEPDWDR